MNLLLETQIRTKVEEIVGQTSDIFLDMVWDTLTGLLGYDISYGPRISVVDGSDSDLIYLPNRPVKSLTAILINGDSKNISDFEVYGQRAVKWLNGIFIGDNLPYGNIVMADYFKMDVDVRYIAGFTADDFPSDLIYASTLLYNKIKHDVSNSGKLSSYKIDTVAYAFKDSKEIDSKIQNILDRYI